MAGLLDFLQSPGGQGLLSAGFGGLAGARRGTPINNIGRAGLAGIAGYSNALDSQVRQQEKDEIAGMRRQQKQHYELQNTATKNRQDALAGLKTKMGTDSAYKLTSADLIEIDPEAAFKHLSGSAVDFGLEPKIGLNPETNRPQYFIQDKRGGTKWLDAGVPDNLRFVPGNDYQAPQAFNPRTGSVSPVGPQGLSLPGMPTNATSISGQQSVGGFGMAARPTLHADQQAPWSHITSAKEQDDMKKRVYEQDNKRLDDLRTHIQQGRSVMSDLNRFGELNRKEKTGAWHDRIDWMPTVDSDKLEMEAIRSRLAPNQRPEGSGSSSDRDMGLYLKAVPGIDKPGDVNKNIRAQYATQLQNAEERFAFMENYLTERGHLTGADKAYKQFQANKNAVPARRGSATAPNRNTPPNWQGVNSAYAAGAAGRDNERLAILRDELAQATNPEDVAALQREINRVGGQSGGTQLPRAGQQAANQPKSKAIQLDGGGSAYATLESDGNYYVVRNGKRYRVEE